MKNFSTPIVAAGVLVALSTTAIYAGPIKDRIAAGEAIRLGFADQPPSAYPGADNAPLGFANAIAIGVLKSMGITKIEPVVTDWGGLIPALTAGRADMVTGGMYILSTRCPSVSFSEPIAQQYDGFFVAKGNPKGINNYADIRDSNAIMVVAAGTNSIEAARKEGVPEANIMSVPGPTEMLAALLAGRADAGALPFVEVERMVAANADTLDASDPTKMPEWTINYTGIPFRADDADFLAEFNTALAAYLASPQVLEDAKAYGYTEKDLPGDKTTEWACANR